MEPHAGRRTSSFSWGERAASRGSRGLAKERAQPLRGGAGRRRGNSMPHYPRYATTVVGAHSVPRWYEALDRLVALGQLAEGDFADAQLRATQAAILEQENAGIDVITGGEMHRRTAQPALAAERDVELLLAKDSLLPGRNAAKADHAIRSERVHIQRPFAAGRSPIPSIWAWSKSSRPSRRSRASR